LDASSDGELTPSKQGRVCSFGGQLAQKNLPRAEFCLLASVSAGLMKGLLKPHLPDKMTGPSFRVMDGTQR